MTKKVKVAKAIIFCALLIPYACSLSCNKCKKADCGELSTCYDKETGECECIECAHRDNDGNCRRDREKFFGKYKINSAIGKDNNGNSLTLPLNSELNIVPNGDNNNIFVTIDAIPATFEANVCGNIIIESTTPSGTFKGTGAKNADLLELNFTQVVSTTQTINWAIIAF
jgi:hypothetical protein